MSRPLSTETHGAPDAGTEGLPLSHAQHLPQLLQALASTDRRFMDLNVSKGNRKAWEAERVLVLRKFLAELANDFVRLERLSRMVECLGREKAWSMRLAFAWLRLRFRVTYAMASMEISTAKASSLKRLVRLAELVGLFSARVQAGMDKFEKPARETS